MTESTALSPVVLRLIVARAVRSVGQGALTVTFTLYLNALHWSAPQIGAVLGGGLLFGAALTLWLGPLSDRLGRKQFLLAYELVLMACSLLAMLSTAGWALVLAAVLRGFGRGANGAAGPFGPLEQAWISHEVPPSQRARVFSLNSTVGFAGMAAGALLGTLPHWLGTWLPQLWGYRVLFLLPLAGATVGFVLIIAARDLSAAELRGRVTSGAVTRPGPPAAASRRLASGQEAGRSAGRSPNRGSRGRVVGRPAPSRARCSPSRPEQAQGRGPCRSSDGHGP